MLASVSAAAIQNAKAFEGEVEQRNLLATVAEISRRVSAILDTEWMLNEVCRLLAGEFDFEWVHVLLVNEPGSEAELRCRVWADGRSAQAGRSDRCRWTIRA